MVKKLKLKGLFKKLKLSLNSISKKINNSGVLAFIVGIFMGIFAFDTFEILDNKNQNNETMQEIKNNQICWNHVGYDADKQQFIWLNDCKGRISSNIILCKPENIPLNEAEVNAFREWLQNGAKMEALNESCKQSPNFQN